MDCPHSYMHWSHIVYFASGLLFCVLMDVGYGMINPKLDGGANKTKKIEIDWKNM